MAITIDGLSTLGVQLAYGAFVDNETLPATTTELGRINQVGGVELSTENIDASALTDAVTKYVAGRADTGGEWTVTVNCTGETAAEWEAIKGTKKWFEVVHPSMEKGWFVVATVPAKLPLPEIGQNELLTFEVNLTLNNYHGLDTKVVPS